MSALFFLTTLLLTSDTSDRQSVILVVGAAGTEEYGEMFHEWAGRWKTAAEKANASYILLGQTSDRASDNRELLLKNLATELTASEETLWLVLIGHGTFDGQSAKFNLRGPDVSAKELAASLRSCKRPLAIVNCASASGPFINELSGPDRIVVTSTKSGYEDNFSRFGDYMSAAIIDEAADLDKDEQTSLLEAFLLASAQVEEFYSQESRLATEHALIDDDGDGKGTPATWFRGVRATRSAKDGVAPDGLRANQFHLIRNLSEQRMPLDIRTRRDKLELELARLRQVKGKIGEDDYYNLLEPVLIELARLYETLDQGTEQPQPTKGTANAAKSDSSLSP